jgi:UPF0716 protein FxsA
MNPGLILFTVFLLVPVIEIYFLIQVGGLIGALPTVFLVVFTAVLGALLLRYQGFITLRNFQRSVHGGQLPAMEIIEGMVLLVAGALLLTPGFFTDAVGFACLVPPLRRALIRHFLGRYTLRPDGVGAGSAGESRHTGPVTIDGECHREDD